jgi:hypothetical protein
MFNATSCFAVSPNGHESIKMKFKQLPKRIQTEIKNQRGHKMCVVTLRTIQENLFEISTA